MADTWKDCLLCGRIGSAVRLHQTSDLDAVTDAGDDYQFHAKPDPEGGLNLWYYCEIDEDTGREGCGGLYAAPYDQTGDVAEAHAVLAAVS